MDGTPVDRDPPHLRVLPSPAPTISNEQLVGAYQRTGDPRELDCLLQRNERLVHHVLKRFRTSPEPYEDLFQVARVGLIKAAQRFDPGRGSGFTTYAISILEGEVRHHLRDNLLVRQPRWAKNLYARIQQAQQEFYQENKRSPTMEELAEAVNVREEGILEVIRAYGMADLRPLDEPVAEGAALPDRRLVRSVRPETFALPIEDRILLYEALGALSDLHKKIIYLMFFYDLTQQQVADEMGLTQRTVSREQTKALSRLKAVLSRKIL